MKEQHVLFGISPFNSKFNDHYLNRMLAWGFDNYINVDVIHPYEEARFLLMGCGDDERKAKKKSRKEFYRAERIINSYLLSTGNQLFSETIVKFSDFRENISYKLLLEMVRKNLQSNDGFREICLEQSRKAIFNRRKSSGNYSEITLSDLDIAAEYIVRELPFLIAPSIFLSIGNSIDISYYCTWPVVDFLYNEKLSLYPCSNTRVVVKDHAM